jgi:hypothetical protein
MNDQASLEAPMEELRELRRPEDIPPPEPKARGGKAVAFLVLVLLGGLGFLGWKYWQAHQLPPATEAPPPAVAEPVPEAPAPAPPEIAEGDALLRKLFEHLASVPPYAGWLEKGLIRPIAAAVNLIADGQSPSQVLSFLSPDREFKVMRKKKKLFIDPQGYARYDKVTQAVTALDVVQVAEAYKTLRPFFEAAYAEVGKPGRTFDEAVKASIDRLVSVPIPKGDVRLERKGLVYAFADESLESRSAAEKHLLRMGPKNMQKLQTKLRSLQAAFEPPPAQPSSP